MNKNAKIGVYQELAFTKRWLSGLDEARRSSGWHIHVADAQHGKTQANKIFAARYPATRVLGQGTHAEIALVTAPSDGRGVLAREIARQVAGLAFARSGHLEESLPAMMKQVGTSLLIINNAHQLRWRQWQQLITLDDRFLTVGQRVGIAFSGIQASVHQIPGLPKEKELRDQISERIVCRKRFEGYTAVELKEVLVRILTPFDASFATAVSAQCELAHRLLLHPILRGSSSKHVGIGRTILLIRTVVAVKSQNHSLSAADALRLAQKKMVERVGGREKPLLAALRAAAGAQAA